VKLTGVTMPHHHAMKPVTVLAVVTIFVTAASAKCQIVALPGFKTTVCPPDQSGTFKNKCLLSLPGV
jgi:hypothetical protein